MKFDDLPEEKNIVKIKSKSYSSVSVVPVVHIMLDFGLIRFRFVHEVNHEVRNSIMRRYDIHG